MDGTGTLSPPAPIRWMETIRHGEFPGDVPSARIPRRAASGPRAPIVFPALLRGGSLPRLGILMARVAHPPSLDGGRVPIQQSRAGTDSLAVVRHDAPTAGPAARQHCSPH